MNDVRAEGAETDLTVDVVVVGGGVAGLVAALTAEGAPSHPRVALLCAGDLVGGCTRWAQGGIAAALGDDDSPDLHAADTVAAGRGLCDEAAVRVLVEEGPARVHELAALGVAFDRDASGGLLLGREAAHSRPRIVHAGGDATGAAIATALARRVRAGGLTLLEGHAVTSLLRDAGGGCAGVEAVDRATGRIRRVLAPATILATGGAGRLWLRTTNPQDALGTGVALAHAAGAAVSSMEFTQFHPTALALDGAPPSLISEAVRGEGALIVDGGGERFLEAADPRAELAPRDVVAAAIWRELERSGASAVYLDCSPIGPDVARRFPTISATLAAHGIDLARSRVPIAPAAHYTIGGVVTDLDGATSVPGLLACGEVASTGVHGANRLASNSLLEGAVFGRRAARAALAHAASAPRPRHVERVTATPTPQRLRGSERAAELETRLRTAMWSGAGLLRDEAGLRAAAATASEVAEASRHLPFPISTRLQGAALTASLVCDAALLREESRGCHQRSDHPEAAAGGERRRALHHDRGLHSDRNSRPAA